MCIGCERFPVLKRLHIIQQARFQYRLLTQAVIGGFTFVNRHNNMGIARKVDPLLQTVLHGTNLL